jgi:capsule polysaccharide export protein KpsC/LpsZ
MVMDRTGIYYDARQPCDLEAYVRRRAFANSDKERAQAAIGELRRLQLSKYNGFSLGDISSLELKTRRAKDRVLVVDQTVGDASIPGAFATAETFAKMLCVAVYENPSAEILVRVHPESMTGEKSGHLGPRELSQLAESSAAIEDALQQSRLRLTPEPINPWALLEACSKVYCVSSQLGFEGLIAGCEVHCFGAAFYGGWGLAEDRFEKPDWHRVNVTIEALFAAVYFDYCRYIDWENLKEITFECAAEKLAEKVEAFRKKEGLTAWVA